MPVTSLWAIQAFTAGMVLERAEFYRSLDSLAAEHIPLKPHQKGPLRSGWGGSCAFVRLLQRVFQGGAVSVIRNKRGAGGVMVTTLAASPAASQTACNDSRFLFLLNGAATQASPWRPGRLRVD